jgi:hypothetical protein
VINILGEVDAHVGTRVELESWLRLEINTDSWMTTKKIEDYLTQLDKKVTESCFSLIIVMPTQRTPYFSATSKLYFSQLTVPVSCSLQIWESYMHTSAIAESS